MPPAMSIREQIMAALATRLATIVEGASYSFTPAGGVAVRPTRIGGYTPVDKLVVLEQEGISTPEDGEFLEGNPPRRDLILHAQVYVFCIASDAATAAIETTCNEREADIIAVFMTDPTLGGLALPSSTWGTPETILGSDGSFVVVIVPLDIRYRTSELNPRTQG